MVGRGCDRLAIVRFPYIDFDGVRHDDGELMVLAAVAPEVGQLFKQLYQRGFPLARARLLRPARGVEHTSGCLRREPFVMMIVSRDHDICTGVIQYLPDRSHFRIAAVQPGAEHWMVPVREGAY